MSARFTSIGGKNNGRTHLPYRPTVNVRPQSDDRTAPYFVWFAAFVVSWFAAAIIMGAAQ